MNRQKTTDDLPEDENFWKSIDSEENKNFLNALILDMIRGYCGTTKAEHIGFIAKLQLSVSMIDAPKDLYKSMQMRKASEEQQYATRDLLSE